MQQIPPDPELKALESALGDLAPWASRLDRDKLMFRAGALSTPGRGQRAWAWPAIAECFASPWQASRFFWASPCPSSGRADRHGTLAVRHDRVGRRGFRFADQGRRDPARRRSGWGIGGSLREARSSASWEVASDYPRFQELVARFGVGETGPLPGPSSVASGSDGSDQPSGPVFMPAGERCGVSSSREFSNPEIPHEPNFCVAGLPGGRRSGLVRRQCRPRKMPPSRISSRRDRPACRCPRLNTSYYPASHAVAWQRGDLLSSRDRAVARAPPRRAACQQAGCDVFVR